MTRDVVGDEAPVESTASSTERGRTSGDTGDEQKAGDAASDDERYCYDVFGISIESEIPLPELPVDDRAADDVDVEIRRGEVASVAAADSDRVRSIEAEPGNCTLSYDSIGSMRVGDGERIVVDLEREDLEESKVVRRLLQGQVFAVLLHQRELLVLHASAVAVGGRAAVFVGPVGAGKTTTAAACHAQGHELLDDDVVAIAFDADGRPMVRPGVPELKLYPTVADELGVDVRPATSEDAGSGKEYCHPPVDVDREPVPLAACYRIEEGSAFAVDTVPPQERIVTLLSNTYNAGLLDTTDTEPATFEACSRVAETTPVRTLTRPNDLGRVSELVELIEADVERSPDQS